MGQRCWGLTETHVVCKTATESESPKELQPAQCTTLVRPQLANKAGWFFGFAECIVWEAVEQLRDPAVRGEVLFVAAAHLVDGFTEELCGSELARISALGFESLKCRSHLAAINLHPLASERQDVGA